MVGEIQGLGVNSPQCGYSCDRSRFIYKPSEVEMAFYKIHAFLRYHLMSKVEEALLAVGAKGFSFCRVKGAGEYVNYFDLKHHVEHARLEVLLEEEIVDQAVDAILQAASCNSAGDGIVAVMPVSRLYRIRDKSEILSTRPDKG